MNNLISKNHFSFSIKYIQVKNIGVISITLYFLYVLFINNIYQLFDDSVNKQTFTAIAYTMMSAIVIMLWFKVLKQSCIDLKSNFKRKIIYTTIAGVIIILTQAILTSIIVINFDLMSSNQSSIEKTASSLYYSIMLRAVLFGPIVEEIVFRGVIFRFLREKTYLLSYLISSFLFAFLHFYKAVLFEGDILQLLLVIPFMIVGIGLNNIYEKTDNIMYPILFHIILNSIAFTVSI